MDLQAVTLEESFSRTPIFWLPDPKIESPFHRKNSFTPPGVFCTTEEGADKFIPLPNRTVTIYMIPCSLVYMMNVIRYYLRVSILSGLLFMGFFPPRLFSETACDALVRLSEGKRVLLLGDSLHGGHFNQEVVAETLKKLAGARALKGIFLEINASLQGDIDSYLEGGDLKDIIRHFYIPSASPGEIPTWGNIQLLQEIKKIRDSLLPDLKVYCFDSDTSPSLHALTYDNQLLSQIFAERDHHMADMVLSVLEKSDPKDFYFVFSGSLHTITEPGYVHLEGSGISRYVPDSEEFLTFGRRLKATKPGEIVSIFLDHKPQYSWEDYTNTFEILFQGDRPNFDVTVSLGSGVHHQYLVQLIHIPPVHGLPLGFVGYPEIRQLIKGYQVPTYLSSDRRIFFQTLHGKQQNILEKFSDTWPSDRPDIFHRRLLSYNLKSFLLRVCQNQKLFSKGEDFRESEKWGLYFNGNTAFLHQVIGRIIMEESFGRSREDYLTGLERSFVEDPVFLNLTDVYYFPLLVAYLQTQGRDMPLFERAIKTAVSSQG